MKNNNACSLLILFFTSCWYSLFATASFGQPDLIVSELRRVSEPGQQYFYAWTIKNVGTTPADLDGPTSAGHDNVAIQSYISSDPNYNPSSDIPAGGFALGGIEPVGVLNPGETRSGSFGIDWVNFDPQTHPYLVVKVDHGEVVAESDETNNTASVLIEQPIQDLLPDLVIKNLRVVEDSNFDISYEFTIENVGSAPANLDGPTSDESDNVSIQAFISSDTVFNNSGDIAAGGGTLGLSPLGNLNPGETRTGSIKADVDFDPSTHPYLTLMIDWGGVVTESDESNNTAATMISSRDSGSSSFLTGLTAGPGGRGSEGAGGGIIADVVSDTWSESYGAAVDYYTYYASFELYSYATAYYYYFTAVGDYDYYTNNGNSALAIFQYHSQIGLYHYHLYEGSSSGFFYYYAYTAYAYYYYFAMTGDSSSANTYYNYLTGLAVGFN